MYSIIQQSIFLYFICYPILWYGYQIYFHFTIPIKYKIISYNIQNRSYNKAIQHARAYLEQEPEDLQIIHNLIGCYLLTQQYEDALHTLNQLPDEKFRNYKRKMQEIIWLNRQIDERMRDSNAITAG